MPQNNINQHKHNTKDKKHIRGKYNTTKYKTTEDNTYQHIRTYKNKK